MFGWLRQAAGGLPRQFWLLWTGTLINRVGGFVVILMAIYLTGERHFSQSAAGLVIGLYGAGGAIGTITGGVLADRWGRRPTLLTAQFCSAALMLTLGLVRGYLPILLVAFVLGVFAESARPAFSAMMIDVVPERDRLRAFSLNYWAINLGFATSAVLAGFAAQFAYLLVFAIDAGTTLLTALIGLFFLSETLASRSRSVRSSDPGLRTVFRDRTFMLFLGLNVLLILVMFQHQSTLPIAMIADGLSPSTYGLVTAVNGLLIVAGQLFVPRLTGGRNRTHVLAVASTFVGIGFGLCAFAHTAGFYALTVVIWTVGEMLGSPANSSLTAELSPLSLRGRYQGVNSLSWSAGAAMAPIVGGFVQQHLGNSVLWLLGAATCSVVAAGQLISGPARERLAAALSAAAATTLTVADHEAIPPVSAAEPLADSPPTGLTPNTRATQD